VEDGLGIGLLLQSAVQKSLEKGSLVELSVANTMETTALRTFLLFRKGIRTSNAVDLFLDFLFTEIPLLFPYITIDN